MASDGFNDGSLAAKTAQRDREARLSERVAVLEAKLTTAEERIAHESEARGKLYAELAKVREEFARIKGIWGGIVLCLGVVSALLTLFRAQISEALTRLFK